MNYQNYTVEELKSECKEKGLSGYSKLKKEELIKFLQENQTLYYYYSDPRFWGETFKEIMNKRKNWEYLEPYKVGKYYYADKIIEEGKWNLLWKSTPYFYFPDKSKIGLYDLSKPNKDLLQVVNHFPNMQGIATKIGLTESLKKYKKEFENIFPKTYILRDANNKNLYNQILQSKNNYWIVKPDKEYGGLGIKFFDNTKKALDFVYESIKKGLTLEEYRPDKPNQKIRTLEDNGWIMQQYISRPLLYRGRKFDIRIHLLLNDTGEIYFCKYGYIRISSVPYKLELSEDEEMNKLVHITNQAFQINSELFGKYEEGNSLLLEGFMKYLQEIFGIRKGKDLYNSLVEDWKRISRLLIEKTWDVINKKKKEIPNRRYHELIGLDFMVDENFNTWLIEANYNPSLDNKNTGSKEIVFKVIEETVKICIDPVFGRKVPKKLKWFERI